MCFLVRRDEVARVYHATRWQCFLIKTAGDFCTGGSHIDYASLQAAAVLFVGLFNAQLEQLFVANILKRVDTRTLNTATRWNKVPLVSAPEAVDLRR